MLNFLKENSYNFQKLIFLEKIPKPSKIKYFEIYSLILKWLRLFVKNNTKHQLVLYEDIEIFFNNLDLDLGQIDLICEIFHDNYELIKNVKDRYLKKFIFCIKNYGCQKKFLDFFEIIICCQNNYILDNQAKIIDHLYLYPLNESEEILYNVLYCEPRDQEEGLQFNFLNVPQNFEDQERKIKSGFSINLYGNQPIDFHIKLLQLFIKSQHGNEGFNLNNSRIKKIFCIKFLLEILVGKDELFITQDQLETRKKLKKVFSLVLVESEKNPKPFNKLKYHSEIKDNTRLKPMVLEFYNEIYLKKPEKNLEQLNKIGNFLQTFISIERDRLEVFEKHFYNNQKFVDYYFGKVLSLFNKYIKFIMKTSFEIDDFDQKDNEDLYSVAEILHKNLSNLQFFLTNEQCQNLRLFISHYYEFSDDLDKSLEQCLQPFEMEKKKLEENNSSFNSMIFDENEHQNNEIKSESITGWKKFLRMILHSDVLENVKYIFFDVLTISNRK